MTQPFHPPWDRPGWILINQESFLARIDQAGTEGLFLDSRPYLVECLIDALPGDLKRRSIKGILTENPGGRLREHLQNEAWIAVVPPPLTSGQITLACRHDAVPVLGLLPEALLASNQAQAHGRTLEVLVRVRSDDLMADHGPGSLLSILEAIPGLPRLSLRGFFLETPFPSAQRWQVFFRAISRYCPDIRTLEFFSRLSGDGFPEEIRKTAVILGEELLNVFPGPPPREPAPMVKKPLPTGQILLIQARGFPIAVKNDRILVEIDLGTEHGIIPENSGCVLVEDIPGHIVAVHSRKTYIEMAERPAKATPWTLSLHGVQNDQFLRATEGEIPTLRLDISRLSRVLPLYLETLTEIRPLSEP